MNLAVLPLLPVLSAAAVAALGRRPRAASAAAVGAMAATVAGGLWAATTTPVLRWQWGPLLQLGMSVEGFGRVMVVLVPAVAMPIVGYAAATERDGRTRLLTLMVAFVGAMELLVTAADLLTLLFAWEIIGALSWGLIAHYWRDPGRPRAALVAFITTRTADLGLYVAAGVALSATGSLAYGALPSIPRPALDWVALGVLVAAAAKSAQVPFSPWLFAAMSGPTPVSALLHSATLVSAGGYVMVRLAPLLEPAGWFLPAAAVLGALTAVSGGVVATLQSDAKRLLAASTSAHYGFVFLAVGAGAAAAGAVHLVTHAFFKSLLFLAAGVAIHAAGSRDLGRMRLGRSFPIVAALSGAGALALAGVPPLGGAWSKESVVAAALAASPFLAAAALAAAFLSAFYAARYQWLAFGLEAGSGRREAEVGDYGSRGVVMAIAWLAAVTLLLSGLWLPGAGDAVLRFVPGRLPHASVAVTTVMFGLAVGAFLLAWILDRRGWLVWPGLPAAGVIASDWLGLPTLQQMLVVRPVFALAARLRRLDDGVIDAGVRAVARTGRLVSRLLSHHGERSADGVVRGVASGFARAAAGSRLGDERAVDRAVEGTAAGITFAGVQSRRLQTGLAHHYYTIMAAGLLFMAALLALL